MLAELIGREAELGILEERWADALAGAPQLVLVAGEPGMGRSALLRKFVERAGWLGQVAQARCLPLRAEAYAALCDVLLDILGCAPGDSPQAIGAALEGHLARLYDAASRAALIGHLLHLPAGKPLLAGLSAAGLQQAAFVALGDFLTAAAANRPLLIAVEDVHWADPGSAQWLSSWAHRLSLDQTDRPVMTLLSVKSGGLVPPLEDLASLAASRGSRFQVTPIELGPLTMQQTFALAEKCLDCKPVGWTTAVRGVLKQVLDRAAGHPAYLVEAIEALVSAGSLVREGDIWRVPEGEAVDLPASVESAIAARLEALPSELRRRLRIAAVSGSRFDAATLGPALGTAMAEGIDELVRLKILSVRGAATEGVREAALAGMSEDARRNLHLEVGDALERIAEGDTARFAGELAHHFSEAQEHPRAYKYLVMQAERSREAGLAAEAARLYREALKAAERIAVWPDTGAIPAHTVRLRLATAYVQIGEFREALAVLDQLKGRSTMSPEAWRCRGTALERSGEIQASLEAMESACRSAGGDGLEAGRSYLALGDIRRRMGKFGDAIAALEQAESLLGGVATPFEESYMYGLRGLCLFRLGKSEDALVAHRKAHDIRKSSGDLEGQANSLNNLGMVAVSERRYQVAEEAFGESLALFCRLGNRPGAAMTLNNLGDLYLKQGRDALAEARLREAHDLAEKLGYMAERVTTTANLAEVYLLRGNHGEAHRLLEHCLSQAVRAGIREFLPEIHAARGRAYAVSHDFAEAKMAYSQAIDLAEKAGRDALASKLKTELGALT
jgi:tetratricopeptide (TPR) repeat protein